MSDSRDTMPALPETPQNILFLWINVFALIDVPEIVQQNDNTYTSKCNQTGLQISVRDVSCVVELTNTVDT